MRALFPALILVSLLLVSLPGRTETDERAAVSAALEWLALVDRGQVTESWEQSSELFRSLWTEQQWASTVRAIRKPLGAVVQRHLLRTQYKESLPDAPDGRYVIIEYRTDYERRPGAVEIVTPMFEDGTWRVMEYTIR